MGGNSLDKYNGLWVVNLVAFKMGLTLWLFLPRQHGIRVGMTLCKVLMISGVRYYVILTSMSPLASITMCAD